MLTKESVEAKENKMDLASDSELEGMGNRGASFFG